MAIQDKFNRTNVIYKITKDIDLKGETLTIPEGCTLDFQGGSFSNGTIVGNNTILQTYHYAIFGECIIKGTWVCDEANTLMFSSSINDNLLFSNLEKISNIIRVYSDREYYITKENVNISANRLYSVGEKPTINFSDGNNGEYNNNAGFIFNSANLCIENIKFTENFNPSTSNDALNGSAIGQIYDIKDDVRIKLINCEFTGNFSSSCFASSYTTDVKVIGCKFYDCYLADHAVYSSINTKSFEVINCNLKNITNTSGIFKVRDSEKFKTFYVDKLEAVDVVNYLFVIAIIADEIERNTNIHISNVNSVRTSESIGNGTFANLGSNKFDGTAKINSIVLENCLIKGGQLKEDGSYQERPLFNSASMQNVEVNEFIGLNNHVERCSLSFSNFINANIINSYHNFGTASVVNNIYLYNSEFVLNKSILQVFINPKNISIINSTIQGSATYLCQTSLEHSVDNYRVSLVNSSIKQLLRNIFNCTNTENPQKIYYDEINCDIIRGKYPIIYGSDKPIILNLKNGTSSNRPTLIENNGYQYFDTTLNKPIWWTGAKWVDATGAEV